VFAGGGIREVGRSIRHIAVMQQFEPDFRVLLLVIRRLGKERGDLLISLFFGLRSVIGVFVSRLGLPSEGRQQIASVFEPLRSMIFSPYQLAMR